MYINGSFVAQIRNGIHCSFATHWYCLPDTTVISTVQIFLFWIMSENWSDVCRCSSKICNLTRCTFGAAYDANGYSFVFLLILFMLLFETIERRLTICNWFRIRAPDYLMQWSERLYGLSTNHISWDFLHCLWFDGFFSNVVYGVEAPLNALQLIGILPEALCYFLFLCFRILDFERCSFSSTLYVDG